MLFPSTQITHHTKQLLAEKIARLRAQGVTPRLLTVVIGDSPAQQSYIRIKRRTALELGVIFESHYLSDTLTLQEISQTLQEKIHVFHPQGVLIQQPLPTPVTINALFETLPPSLDIEGHINSEFSFPLVEACMIALGWIYRRKKSIDTTIHLDFITLPYRLSDQTMEWLRRQRIVIAGRGLTTGKPIARLFDVLHIPYAQTDTQTQDPDSLYRQADIIISGVGKNIINQHNIKEGVCLLNFGLREVITDGKRSLEGDYVESVIKEKASIYTSTPGGLGPLDVLCMYANLIQTTIKNSA